MYRNTGGPFSAPLDVPTAPAVLAAAEEPEVSAVPTGRKHPPDCSATATTPAAGAPAAFALPFSVSDMRTRDTDPSALARGRTALSEVFAESTAPAGGMLPLDR